MIYPKISYPYALDSDYTLFRVVNRTQSVLASELDASSSKIEIIPASDTEVWPENGFVSLPGELVYYDMVDRNSNGKISVLKRCTRGVEGSPKYYAAGTPIYGNVIAQHHNQLVEAIIEIERTIGEVTNETNAQNNVTQQHIVGGFGASLHTALNAMKLVSSSNNDQCPDVVVEFNSPIPIPSGTQCEFCVRVYPFNPSDMTYRLDFGDGSYTTTEFSGQHLFSTNATPSVTISTSNCQLVVQAATLDVGSDISPFIGDTPQPFYVSIPDVPDFPSFIAPRRVCPGPLMNLPPMQVPYLELCSVVPMSSETPVDLCTVLVSVVGCAIPHEISVVGCHVPSLICFCEPPSFTPIKFDTPPSVHIDWGTPPVLSVVVICPPNSTPQLQMLGEDFQDGFAPEDIPVTLNNIGIPEEIKIVAPKIPDIKLIHDIPHEIALKTIPIPDIRIVGHNIPEKISIVGHIPDKITIDTDIPRNITLDATDIPRKIIVEPAPNFPSVIQVEGIPDTIRVTGIPPTIEVVGNIPNFIQLVMPDDPTIELVWKGAPFELGLRPEVEKLLSQIMIVNAGN